MKLAAIKTSAGSAVGVVLDGAVLNLTAAWEGIIGGSAGRAPTSVADLAAQEAIVELVQARLDGAGAPSLRPHLTPLADARLGAPVPAPGKLICVASNYAAHIEEAGRDVPPDRHLFTPWLFLKPSTSVIGPGAAIPIPREGQAIDWEVELAVVIGRPGKYLPVARALDHVFGYTVLNDISERRFHAPDGRPAREWDRFFDWQHGKWFDGFAPMGPWVVTTDEIPDPQALAVELRVNGRARQRGSTAQMIYPVAELIAFASSIMTLEPGDVIATGTPHGVGATTGEFLKPGDVVECEVEGIGRLVNPVRAEDDPSDPPGGARG